MTAMPMSHSTMLSTFPGDTLAWRSIVARDPRYDGTFVFAVASTGIYCRPSCPARRPRRQNVSFFASPGEAEAAGFRACKRCRPAGEAARSITAHIAAAHRYLDAHLDERVTLPQLAGAVGVSPFRLLRAFQREMGVSPRGYVEARRLERLKSELRTGRGVSRATYAAGFSSSSRVYERAAGRLGMTPATYGRGGAGMVIRYTITDCALGRLLVGATERGLASVTLGENDATLLSALRHEYPAAEVVPGGAELDRWVQDVVRQTRGEPALHPLPLDLAGTAFEQQVWRELQRIPVGTTRSYREIAQRIGKPAAARAVASACARNRVALVIPCHRVVRQDGGMGGYRWGVARKRKLLLAETGARARGPARLPLRSARQVRK